MFAYVFVIAVLLFAGSMVSALILSFFESRYGWNWWIFAALTIVFAALIFVALRYGYTASVKMWNDGICSECGGRYGLVDTACDRYGHVTRWIYQCDNCHRTLCVGYAMQ